MQATTSDHIAPVQKSRGWQRLLRVANVFGMSDNAASNKLRDRVTMADCFQTRDEKDVLVLTLNGSKLQASMLCEEFHEELLVFIRERKPLKLVISLTDLKSISSAAIGALIDARKAIQEHDGQLRLCELSDTIRTTFQILNLDGTLFTIFETESSAVDEPWRSAAE